MCILMHQIVPNHTLLWQTVSQFLPLHWKLARASHLPWREVAEQELTNLFHFCGDSDSREGEQWDLEVPAVLVDRGMGLLFSCVLSMMPLKGLTGESFAQAHPQDRLWEGVPLGRGAGTQRSPLPAGQPAPPPETTFPLH